MKQVFYWRTIPISFIRGETYAAALLRGNVLDMGPAAGGMRARYFCGIGACQSCLVSVNGQSPVEACLTTAKEQAQLMPSMEKAGADVK